VKPYGWRDKIVWAIANTVLRFASRRYQDMIRGSVTYGLRSAARDVTEGRTAP
jgi:hypothetical protein